MSRGHAQATSNGWRRVPAERVEAHLQWAKGETLGTVVITAPWVCARTNDAMLDAIGSTTTIDIERLRASAATP